MAESLEKIAEVVEKKLHLREEHEQVVEQEPVIKTTIKEPEFVDKVIDEENVEVHKREVVTEIHKQPVIEVVEKPITDHIYLDTVHEKTVKSAIVEEVDHSSHTPFEIEKVIGHGETEHLKERSKESIREGTVIKSVEVVPEVEIHEVPRVTEVYHQKIVHHEDQPVTRIIYEEPIIRYVVDKSTTLHSEEHLKSGRSEEHLRSEEHRRSEHSEEHLRSGHSEEHLKSHSKEQLTSESSKHSKGHKEHKSGKKHKHSKKGLEST